MAVLCQPALKYPVSYVVFKGDKSVDKVIQLLHKVPSISPAVRLQKAPNCKETPPTFKPNSSIQSTPEAIVVSEVVAGNDVDTSKHVWVSANKNTLATCGR